ncbi:Nuclear Hormone Receptor family [Caenorhabditis elegans]|uniref:Nuclear Hormone Receptor family n=1 Tax=Caenorhabditis elegans TaxID=6239 RepID=O61872_CAEEL|nr:Nuclear Hormone Receptor family [Caenorhabditis elegans]CCD74349.1 Nuclear Hormone Receptor family [Caenorhabditis elegans]|eukprot:NP_503191.1 Nuclear Hormone Receptor family [Caenorhabditis elegans]
MVTQNQKCSVCDRFTTEFNYSVPSCNACKIFFRRLITRTMPIKKCFLGENCFERPPFTRKCAACRFQKCLHVGMSLPSFLHLGEQNKEKCLDGIIRNLENLNFKRNDLTCNYRNNFSNPSIEEVIRMNKIDYVQISNNFQMSHKHWAFHCCLVTVDYMKKFPFVNLLRYDDQKFILKEYYIRLKAIISAIRSVRSGKDRLIFPDGSDVLAQAYLEWDLTRIPSNLIQKIRYRLVARLIELKITNEEHLLLSVLIYCNPGSQQLSQNGKILLTSYQSLYSSALLQYCLITYQRAGPSRFTELLGVYETIEVHYNDLISYHVLVQLNQSKVELMQLVKDGIDGAYKIGN